MLAAAAATAHCIFCHGCCFASPYGALFVLLSDVSGLMSDGWILFPAFVIRVRVRVERRSNDICFFRSASLTSRL